MNSATIDDDVDLIQQNEIDRLEETVRRKVNGGVRDFRLREVAEGLILLGHATTYYAKQLAQHAIMDTTQRTIVANEIEVA